jgi:DDE domain
VNGTFFVDASTIWRWVQRYAPELNVRIRRELKPTNGSWRTDETYVRVAGRWTYLYRVVDSTGATIDFLLSKTRDLTAARNFFQKALASPGHITVHHANAIASAKYSRKPVRCQAITVAAFSAGISCAQVAAGRPENLSLLPTIFQERVLQTGLCNSKTMPCQNPRSIPTCSYSR